MNNNKKNYNIQEYLTKKNIILSLTAVSSAILLYAYYNGYIAKNDQIPLCEAEDNIVLTNLNAIMDTVHEAYTEVKNAGYSLWENMPPLIKPEDNTFLPYDKFYVNESPFITDMRHILIKFKNITWSEFGSFTKDKI